MKNFSFVLCLSLLASCGHTPDRKIAQVDNQIEAVLERHSQSKEMMPKSGIYAPYRIENNLSRTIRLLTPADKDVFGIDHDHLSFANFRHLNKHYIVELVGMRVDQDNRPMNSYGIVQSVDFLKEHWAAEQRPEMKDLETHSLLHFKFSKIGGIRLIYNQTDREYVSSSEPLITEAVLSWETIRSSSKRLEDQPFLPSGLKYDYAAGYLFYSKQERERMIREEKRHLVPHALDFSKTKSLVARITSSMDALLYTAIRMSNDYGRNQTYNIMSNNCTARAIDVLDRSLKYTAGIQYERVKQSAIDFANRDSKAMMGYLLKMAKEKKFVLPAEVEKQMVELSSGVLLKKASDINFDRMNNPKNFLYEVPPFVDAHLRARQLIP